MPNARVVVGWSRLEQLSRPPIAPGGQKSLFSLCVDARKDLVVDQSGVRAIELQQIWQAAAAEDARRDRTRFYFGERQEFRAADFGFVKALLDDGCSDRRRRVGNDLANTQVVVLKYVVTPALLGFVVLGDCSPSHD